MLLYGVLIVALAVLIRLAVRPSMVTRRAGRVFAFVALVVVPVTAGFMGLEAHIERSKTVAFCTSCHVMQRYESSLHIDDIDHLPAKHYQYNRVPRETACFACHTDYTMYGDYTAKLRGLKHVYKQYIGTIPAELHLYTPYNNRECLHCHEGARSFLEAVTHKSEPGRFEALRQNKQSCLTKGCHDVTHTVTKLDGLPSWPKPPAKEEAKEEGKR